MVSFYDLKATKPSHEQYTFDQLKGKVVLVVNTASKCGYTPQFAELEELNKKYADQGLQIIGFPCNQFAGQDPENDEKIGEFCQRNYGVTFPMMAKSDVNGSNTNEVFQFLKKQKSGILGTEMIKWNFTKFLVDKQGNVIERYGSNTKPSSIAPVIEKLLAQ
ncbi:probable GPX2 - glutathione peroxidase [Melanopsichium pennsylvanicum]|uniref:Glutathione peroxidase n=2 Tax=Melanopsichium pennsylvanicum TaxID=63383 RepID=A0AAJ5C433_9BASI|nr:probable GPX2-glutathione peroxidase [Melanopsichium pennsylvanicum 4]SNX83084.1 probable GPX2 - glutathione peroxidase [Melanopsichium pennsylvanicum]